MKKRLILFLLRLFATLPLSVHHALAHFVGWMARVVVGYRKDVVKQNIADSFPELSVKEREIILKDFYLHLGQLICEFIWFGGSSTKRIKESEILRFSNPEEFKRLHEVAPSTVLLCSHFGNWELFAGAFDLEPTGTLNSDNSVVVYRKLKDKVWDEIFRENRTACLTKEGKTFDNYIESASIMRFVLEHKDKKMFYYMNTDQWPYFKAPSYIEVSFMGRKTRTLSGAAKMAQKLHFAVSYLAICRREDQSGYDVKLSTICDDASQMSLQQIMDEYYTLLENDIRQDPGNYIWSHKRWKKY